MNKNIWILLLSVVSAQTWASDSEDEDVFYDAYDTDQRAYSFGKCPICWDNKKLDGTLQCGHTYCKPCIQTSYQNNPNCPFCRAEIKSIDGKPVAVSRPRIQYIANEQPRTPANHQFRYNNGRILIALPYRRDVVNFIQSLTQEEYTALMNMFDWRPGQLETAIGGSTLYGDSEFLPLEDRRALFFASYGIPMRPDYRRPWIPLWIRANLIRRSEQNRRQHERSQNNVRALLNPIN